jgi:hypothetical protein
MHIIIQLILIGTFQLMITYKYYAYSSRLLMSPTAA